MTKNKICLVDVKAGIINKKSKNKSKPSSFSSSISPAIVGSTSSRSNSQREENRRIRPVNIEKRKVAPLMAQVRKQIKNRYRR